MVTEGTRLRGKLSGRGKGKLSAQSGASAPGAEGTGGHDCSSLGRRQDRRAARQTQEL